MTVKELTSNNDVLQKLLQMRLSVCAQSTPHVSLASCPLHKHLCKCRFTHLRGAPRTPNVSACLSHELERCSDVIFAVWFRSLCCGASGEESTWQCRRQERCRFDPWVRKIPQRRVGQHTPVFLLGESRGQRSLADCSPWGHKQSLDMTEET